MRCCDDIGSIAIEKGAIRLEREGKAESGRGNSGSGSRSGGGNSVVR